ncbi:Ger(x)C family spore germination protein [Clostridiaceae bacterium NSJ-31]|uniref:Ger(X)C family spore germination protein n=1 Tax=Ligaoa zhengdingensis TaxID=2763658 RepID=A0A926DWU1_9FIRM|nr:Ger(x)C family spore germination protein [Ligaoa zhengdingensis]MBC8545546.1 Ger(x)C family spore germination protein [Ligaoa zhengdingensis]
MKRIRLIALLFALCLPLCGCMQAVRLNNRAIVQGIGIDLAEDGYLVTLQIFDAKGGGSQTAVDASKANSMTLQASGRTIAEAISAAELKQGKEIFYGQNKLIVVGEEVARQGLETIISFFNANPQSRPNVDIAMADGRAVDVMTAQISQGVLPVLSVKSLLENSRTSGRILRGQVLDVVDAIENGRLGTFMPILVKSGEGEEETVEVLGTALYRHSQLVGRADEPATRGLLWLRDDVKRTDLVVQHPKLGDVSLAVVRADTHIQPQIVDGVPHFVITCKTRSHINESIVTPENAALFQSITDLERMETDVIRAEMERALELSLRDCGTDLLELANLLDKYQHEWFVANCERYDELLPQFTWELQVSSEITRYGLQT